MPQWYPLEHNRQCVLAAHSSRLDPNALHPGEIHHLKSQINESHQAVYLQLRNSVLRLWTRNPLIAVSRSEALDCVKERRLAPLLLFAHEWLARNGFINFGCVEIPNAVSGGLAKNGNRKTVVIVGAGVAGLTCARQLEAISKQFPEYWTSQRKEELPRVVLLEARSRIGGRVYSHPLRNQISENLPHGLNNTAEIGAQIITGFDHGNPLNTVIRGQLALEYHKLKDNLILYDHDGTLIDPTRDARIQSLFNDILEIASEHSWKPAVKIPANGIRTTLAPAHEQRNHITANYDRFGCNKIINGTNEPPSLGSLMDGLVLRYRKELKLSSQDLRILNWHFANLEYANAVNVSQLSLGGWDQDSGNEFEGRHTQVIGGYSQLVRGIFKHPSQLDVELEKEVQCVHYSGEDESTSTLPARVVCTDGSSYEADHVVSTFPLGVLQQSETLFNPPLPTWKSDAVHRLGFGVLNKVILVFEEAFWEKTRDMFGLLNPSDMDLSLNQLDYSRHRGRFYLFWNCLETSGRPMLVGLMAGDAALDAENIPQEELVKEATQKLKNMFSLAETPKPVEVLVTRWMQDPYARGTYSYLGTKAQPGDYEAMARPVGNLHFAGEATCGTHPATVHGAFISGLRAAAEVTESMIGPIPPPCSSQANGVNKPEA